MLVSKHLPRVFSFSTISTKTLVRTQKYEKDGAFTAIDCL